MQGGHKEMREIIKCKDGRSILALDCDISAMDALREFSKTKVDKIECMNFFWLKEDYDEILNNIILNA
jgi:hypothetical protein